MSEFEGDISAVNIEDELKQSYLDYAMRVIIGRALPDVRDGLKPVHRRCLFAMYQANNSFDRPTIKSARIVGDVIGRYHPHGDAAAYDAIVRMAQPFSMRYPLVEGQGNFGSLDGDNAAHQRYTEVRMQRIARELVADLDKETVNFVDNYDASLQMPEVFPTRIPNLLANGSNGIAVGMATNIPPHNLTEVINGCLAILENPDIDVDGLMVHIQGPDFPTGAFVNGRAGIVSAYRTGRGRILIRARCEIESDEKTGKDRIIVTEIPYQLNRARLIERIAELVKEKKVEGITELRDESAADTRIVIELRRGELGEVVLNNLYAQTQLQSVFGINMVALVDGQPKVLNLKELIEAFLQHRREVVIRRTVFLLRRARSQGHIREGYAIALENIDPVIEMIKASSDTAEAREKLMSTVWQSDNVVKMLERAGTDAARPDDLAEEFGLKDDGYHLSHEQAQAILQMQLNRLTNLEQDKLIAEYDEIITEIQGFVEILEDPDVLQNLIREELEAVREEYGDERRTEIVSTQEDLTAADLIPEQEMVVTLSSQGYAKTQPITDYQAQHRGGRGRSASSVKEEDFIERLIVANSHDTILCFTNRGKVYWLRVFEIPAASRASRGRPMVNILPLEADERINAMLPVTTYDEGQFIFMATGNGTVKKTPLTDFARPRSSGLIAIELEPGNPLVGVAITDGTSDVMLFGSGGKVIRFKESDVRAMGRTARGVRGIKLRPSEQVISLIIPEENAEVLVASDRGYGKRSQINDFSVIGRGGQGMIGMKLGDRNGEVVSAVQVHEGDEAMLISDRGTLVRIRTEEVSQQGRNTQGVRLINLAPDEKLVGIARVQEPEDDPLNDAESASTDAVTNTTEDKGDEPQSEEGDNGPTDPES